MPTRAGPPELCPVPLACANAGLNRHRAVRTNSIFFMCLSLPARDAPLARVEHTDDEQLAIVLAREVEIVAHGKGLIGPPVLPSRNKEQAWLLIQTMSRA